MIGNGTKQGGVLSPYLFTRYVRPLLHALSPGASVGLLGYARSV